MVTDRELMQQALEALEWVEPSGTTGYGGIAARNKAITALRLRLARESTHSDECWRWHHECAVAKLERLAQPEQEPVAWTPVSVAMPKSGVTVLACYKNSHDKVRRIRARWTAAKTEEASGECEWGEYDEDADTYWTPEGWYECIDNWDDYTSVFVHEGEITHWMPMPTDPYTAPRCKYGNEPTSCTSSPMDCQCALDAVFEQPAQQPLSNGEIYTAYITATNQTLRAQDERLALAFARAIEQAHGIGEKK